MTGEKRSVHDLATRAVTNDIRRSLDAIRREAQAISEAAARIAADPERALKIGEVERLLADTQALCLRGVRATALSETMGLYNAEEETP